MRQALRETTAGSVSVSPQSTDRRSVRTRTALRQALADEIEATGDLSRVTVTSVTERAGVTRRTFYSHFRDIPDLVNQIEEETLADFRGYVVRISETSLAGLQESLNRQEPAPGSIELLRCIAEKGSYLKPLLGDGGDPAFAERIKRMVREVVQDRALDGLDLRALGSFFDYYLTFAISAEVGVLLRWLEGGMRESVGTMARLMTALMFVRPGDLYETHIDFDIPSFALATLCPKEDSNDR